MSVQNHMTFLYGAQKVNIMAIIFNKMNINDEVVKLQKNVKKASLKYHKSGSYDS